MTQAQTQLDNKRNNVADMYPLSPMQEGILFHSIADPKSGQYVPQTAMRISGAVDREKLKGVWQRTIERHAVLRSGFYWEEKDTPFQIVFKYVPLSWCELDWSGEDTSRHPGLLSELFETNRNEPFNLRRPPLVRIQWIRVGADEHILVLCYHHIILDGWSVQQLLDEVLASYCNETGHIASAPPTVRSYGDYIGWLKKQDNANSIEFWKEYLSKTSGPTRFLRNDSASNFSRLSWNCPDDLFTAIKAFSHSSGCTLNSIMQSALALLIGRQTDRTDLIFGTTASGRPGNLSGSTNMIGLFINTLPVRITIVPDLPLSAWIADLQKRQAATLDHEYIPLREIQGSGASLFDTLMVVENFNTNSINHENLPFKTTPITFDERTHFPLTIWLTPQTESMSVLVGYNPDNLAPQDVEAMINAFTEILSNIVSNAEETVEAHLARIEQMPAGTGFATWQHQPVKDPTERSLANELNQGAISPTESILIGIWSTLLKKGSIGKYANFFDLGGHSLLAARVTSRLRNEFAVELPVRTLFERPVLCDLAAHIDELRTGSEKETDQIEIRI